MINEIISNKENQPLLEIILSKILDIEVKIQHFIEFNGVYPDGETRFEYFEVINLLLLSRNEEFILVEVYYNERMNFFKKTIYTSNNKEEETEKILKLMHYESMSLHEQYACKKQHEKKLLERDIIKQMQNEGKRIKTLEIVNKLLEAKCSTEFICEIIGYTKEEYQKLLLTAFY